MKKKADSTTADSTGSPTSVSVASSMVPIEVLRRYSSPKPTKKPRTIVPVRLSNAKRRELGKKHHPPQSWFDKDEEGLY